MNWSHIQNAGTVPGQSTATVTLSQAATEGDLLVASVITADFSGTAPTISDSAGSTYTAISHVIDPGGGGQGATLWLYYATVPNTTAGLQVTATSPSGNCALAVDEFNVGAGATISVLGSAFNQGGGAAPVCGPLTWTPGILALVYGSAAIIDYNAESASSPIFTVDYFHEQSWTIPGITTFYGLNDISGSAAPAVQLGNSGGTLWAIGGAAFGAIATSNQVYVSGPPTGVTGAVTGEFSVRLGGPAAQEVIVTPTSSVAGDQFLSADGSPISSVTIPAGSLLGTFRLLTSSSGTRSISVAAPGYAAPGGPAALDTLTPVAGSLHVTQPALFVHSSGPAVTAFGGQTAAGIGWWFRANSLAGANAGNIPVLDWAGGDDGAPLMSWNSGTQQATISVYDSNNRAWQVTLPLMCGVGYNFLVSWGPTPTLYVNGLPYATAPFGNATTYTYSSLKIGCGAGAGVSVDYDLANVAIWRGYAPTSIEVTGMVQGNLLPVQTATAAAAYWTLGGTDGASLSLADPGLIDLAGNDNTWSMASGSSGLFSYAPDITPGSPTLLSAYVAKSGKLAIFGACGAAAGSSGGYPIAPITAVSAIPTIERGGVPVSIGPPIWTAQSHDAPFVSFLLECGGVQAVAIESGGSGYTNPSASWTGDGTGLVLGTPTLASGIVGYVIENAGSGLPEPPSVVISDPTGSGASAYAVLGYHDGYGSWVVYSVVVTAGGSGYTSPTVAISGGGGSGATAVAYVAGGAIAEIEITYPGYGYNATPSVSVPASISAISGANAGLIPSPFTIVYDAGAGSLAGQLRTITPSCGGVLGCGTAYSPTSLPTVSFMTGTGAQLAITIGEGGAITGIAVAAPYFNYYGNGTYPAEVQLNISDPTGTGASATATLSGGSFEYVTVTDGGSGYTNPSITIAPAGSPISIRPVVSNYIASVPVTATGSDFTSPPAITVSDPTGTGAMVAPIMTGAAAGDVFTYSAPANWFTPTLGGLPLGGIQAVTNASMTNSVGQREPAIGGFACFAQTPTLIAGGNVGEQPSYPWSPQFTAKNRYFQGGAWSISDGGTLTTTAAGEVSSWTQPTSSILSRWIVGPSGSNDIDSMGMGGPLGQWTLQYDDPGVNSPAAMALWLSGGTAAMPVNLSGPNAGTTAPLLIDSADISVSGGGIASIGLAHTTVGSGWQGAIVMISGGGGSGAIATAQVSGGVLTGLTVVCPGTYYSSAPTVAVYGTTVSGTTITSVFDVELDTSTATTWAANVSLYAAGPAGTDSNGHWTVSGIWIVTPDAVTRQAVPIDRTQPLATDDSAIAALTSPTGRSVGVLRFMDVTEGYGGVSNYVWPSDLISADGPAWGTGREIYAYAVAARYINTDPSNTNYAWSSPKIYGGQCYFTNQDPPFSITGTLTAGSATVSGLSSGALMVGSTVSGTGVPATDADGNPTAIAAIASDGSSFTLSAAATTSGSATLTVTNPPYLTLATSDNGAFAVYNQANAGYQSVVVEFRTAQPHGLSSGQLLVIWAATAQVTVPVTSASPFAPTIVNGGFAWVSGPYTVVTPCYIPNNLNPGTPSSDLPQTVASTTEIDLTAGGTLPGWLINVAVPYNTECVPYDYPPAMVGQLPGCAYWCNIPLAYSDALVRTIARKTIAGIGPTNDVYLEYANELWNGSNSMTVYAPMVACLWSYLDSGTIAGYIPANGTVPGDIYRGVSVPLAAHAYDVFEAEWTAAGLDPSRIHRVYGSFWNGWGVTQATIAAANQYNIRVDHVAIAPYLSLPDDWPIVQAFSPATSTNRAAGSWPADAMNDLFRHWMAYSNYNQGTWQAQIQCCLQSNQTSKPTLVIYEGGATTCVPNGVPYQYQLLHDTFAHPSFRDAVWGWYAACQQGCQSMASSGATLANYYQIYNSVAYGDMWVLAYGTGQAAGDGLAYAYKGSSRYATSPNQYATIQGGWPADGKDHNGGPQANKSTALMGLRDWIDVASPAPVQPTTTARPRRWFSGLSQGAAARIAGRLAR